MPTAVPATASAAAVSTAVSTATGLGQGPPSWPALPVRDALPALLRALADPGAAVLIAPPGAGKTTLVPLALRDALARGALPGADPDGKIVVLQPRRIAARATAARMAALRGTALGLEVGYAIRFERRVSAQTRIEVVTEGLLVRRIQADPGLQGVAAVVVDELHERSLDVDLSLAMLAEVRRSLRPELRLLAMSATLDPTRVAALLGDAPVLQVEVRSHPVEVRYLPSPRAAPLPQAVAHAVAEACVWLDAHPPMPDGGPSAPGHVLVFLPGMAEIRACADALQRAPATAGCDVRTLHGAAGNAEQEHALAPSPRRKIVLSTNVAETSLTVDGVAAVVDSGQRRRPRLDPSLGLSRLELGRVSQAAADQRAGRAGRQRSGLCLRLWSAAEHGGMDAFDRPEIADADLAGATLQVRAFGCTPRDFAWFEAPPPARLEAAEAQLRALGAVAGDRLTPLGAAMAELPLAPRLARVLLAGVDAGEADRAARLCALASEPDILQRPPAVGTDSDLDLRLQALDEACPPGGRPARGGRFGADLDPAALRRVIATYEALRPHAHALQRSRPKGPSAPAACTAAAPAAWLLAGFPDRVARRRSPGSDRLLLASGHGARLGPHSSVRDAELMVAIVLEPGTRGERTEAVVQVAAALDPAWLPLEERLDTDWDDVRAGVRQRLVAGYGAIIVRERPASERADPAAASALLAARAAVEPERALGLADDAVQWLWRLRWLAGAQPSLALPTWPGLGHAAPGEALGAVSTEDVDVFAALADGRRSFADLQRLDLPGELRQRLTARQQQALEVEAPQRLTLPSGFGGRVRYQPLEPPTLSVRLQDAFGLEQTPRVAGGRVPVRVELLAPNGRPAAITSDLAGFWAGAWREVRKELRGRYPKHSWPETPAADLARRKR